MERPSYDEYLRQERKLSLTLRLAQQQLQDRQDEHDDCQFMKVLAVIVMTGGLAAGFILWAFVDQGVLAAMIIVLTILIALGLAWGINVRGRRYRARYWMEDIGDMDALELAKIAVDEAEFELTTYLMTTNPEDWAGHDHTDKSRRVTDTERFRPNETDRQASP